MNFDWDRAGAEKDFKKALELNPHSPLALDGYVAFLEFQRRFVEAIAASKTALDLEHLARQRYVSPYVQAYACWELR